MGMSAMYVPAQEISALPWIHHWKHFIISKGRDATVFWGYVSLRGLTVFNNYTPEGISVLKKCLRKPGLGFL